MGAPPVKTLGTIHDRWAEIVGPALAQHSRPTKVLDGVLQIGCDEASWASQIGWMDDQIKRRCAEVFDGLTIVRVRVSVTPAGAP
jgi:predicted nucleic acid-binding Zn ribbon protein